MSWDFNPKDLRVKSLQGGGFDAKQVPNFGPPSLVKVLTQVGSIIDARSRTKSPYINIDLGALKGSSRVRKGG